MMFSTRSIGVTLTLAACAVLVLFASIRRAHSASPASGGATFGSSPVAQNETGGKVITRLALPKPVALTSPSATIQFHLTPQASAAITKAVEGKATRLFLNVVGIDYRQNPGAGYEIYLNPPTGT